MQTLKNFLEKFTKLIVHAGGIHRDDLYVMAVFAALTGRPIERKRPSDEQVSNPGILVADVGGGYCPGQGNFDHHNVVPKELEGLCAFGLIMAYLGISGTWSWYKMLNEVDCYGPGKPFGKDGFRDVTGLLRSPWESVLMGTLSHKETITNNWRGYGDLRLLGEQIILEHNALNDVISDFEVKEVSGVNVAYYQKSNANFDADLLSIGLALGADLVVIPSDRDGESNTLLRIADSVAIDCSRLSGVNGCVFTHSGGFIAKLGNGIHDLDFYVKAVIID